MDFDSPDVEKDFPGLYTSKGEDGKSKKSKEDSDYSEEEHDKVSKKDLLIGRRKDKKDKGKDRGYAALEGESSPEEELDTKSPSKSKKSKAFKFTSSKSKEKREKSRDKEKNEKDLKEEEKPAKEKPEKEKKKEGKKDKDKKDKKEKKTKQLSAASEEVLELGDVQPVFGVSVSLATERSRCHDGVDMPLIVRDCIDYLQEHALKNDQIYKVEPVKTRLQHFKRLYNNRERQADSDELDMPTACSLLKMFMRELPEPVLTTDLIARFEEVASYPQITRQQEELQQLLELLPNCNRTLLCWCLLHFDAVIENEKSNKMNAQSLAMLLSPPLQMSHRLLVALLCHSSVLFPNVKLTKYVPPLTSSSPKLPDTPEDIQAELRKQESLLAQIHSEMNAGFVSKKREEQLWEVQRIITQLKRKLRSFEKKHEKSIDDQSSASASVITTGAAASATTTAAATVSAIKRNSSLDTVDAKPSPGVPVISKPANKQPNGSDDESIKTALTTETIVIDPSSQLNSQGVHDPNRDENAQQQTQRQRAEQLSPIDNCHSEGLYVDEDSGYLMLPKTHPDYGNLLRLQLENQELLAWKAQLQARIGVERAEILRLKQSHQQQQQVSAKAPNDEFTGYSEADYDRIMEKYVHENALLEHKRQILAKEIFEERRECIALQVELAMQNF